MKLADDLSGIISEDTPRSSGGYGVIGKVEFTSPSGRQTIETLILNNQRINGDQLLGTYCSNCIGR